MDSTSCCCIFDCWLQSRSCHQSLSYLTGVCFPTPERKAIPLLRFRRIGEEHIVIFFLFNSTSTSDFIGPRYIPGEAHALYASFVYLDRRYRGPGDLAGLEPAPAIYSRRLQQGGDFRFVHARLERDQTQQNNQEDQKHVQQEPATSPARVSLDLSHGSPTDPVPLITVTETASDHNCSIETVDDEERTRDFS